MIFDCDKPLHTIVDIRNHPRMKNGFVFGYGSLVNRATHNFTLAKPARIQGWRRAWQHVEGRNVAFLSAVPAPGASIDGLVALVAENDWDALDQREASYDRAPAEGVLIDEAKGNDYSIQIYHAPAGKHVVSSDYKPLLMSYLGVVVQGYLQEFGSKGVTDFFETTDGWGAPILDDRSSPIYPRHQILTEVETELLVQHLASVGARVISGSEAEAYRRTWNN